ncbi:hypothetical protein [Paraburkholderia sp. J76]|uniref:hypothetical protein n=1 Tax=Paraburkholderia sp. J76 TaxID=2805439 RepID=UPI002ABD22C6|nr:hypothetical protein [Paraburkholderia sp. J76]
MTFPGRFLFVCVFCVFALFAVRGAAACEHTQRIGHAAHGMVAAADHCGTAKAVGMTNTHGHGSHGACGAGCCVAGCGVHCGAPPVASALGLHVPAGSPLNVLPVPLRAGITHAPPLPPPIV